MLRYIFILLLTATLKALMWRHEEKLNNEVGNVDQKCATEVNSSFAVNDAITNEHDNSCYLNRRPDNDTPEN